MKKAPPDYVARIRGLDQKGIVRLWTKIESRKVHGWPSGKALEYLVIRLFELDGATVEYPYNVFDRATNQILEQIDGFVQVDGLSMLIETKDFRDPMNVEPIAKLRNQLLRRPAGLVGSIFSYSGFTDPAAVLAAFCAPQAILLWTGDEIAAVVDGYSITSAMRIKYSILLRDGVPDSDFRGNTVP